MTTAENYVRDASFIRETKQYEVKVHQVFRAAYFEAVSTFKNSFVLLSTGGKNSKIVGHCRAFFCSVLRQKWMRPVARTRLCGR